MLMALAMVLVVGGCAAGSGQSSGDGAADPADSGSPTAADTGCGRDEVMSRPCPDGAPKAAQSHRPRYKSDQGDAAERYRGDAYHGQSNEYCKPRLAESFQAYKACVRY